MTNTSKQNLFFVAVIALALMAGSLLMLSGGDVMAAPEAAPAAAPTPVSVTDSGGNNRVITFLDSPTLATGANTGNGFNVADFERVDLQYVIDQGTTPNTVTVKLQFSNDNTNWTDGATIVTDNAADANVMQQYAVFGRYARAHVTAGNDEATDIDVIAVAK